MHPGDDEDDQPVTVSNHFRAELVTIEVAGDEGGDGQHVDRFPIRTNERQAPIEAVDISNEDRQRNVFSSRNFRMRLPEEFQHILERKVEPIVRPIW